MSGKCTDDVEIKTDNRFIYTTKKNGTLIIIDKKDNVLIRDKYRACDYLNRLNNENRQLKQKIKSITEILNEDMGYIESLRKIEKVLK